MNNQRLGYQLLAETLIERGLVESKAVEDALVAEDNGGPLFPDALIEANLVADWELSHLVCQLYSLPFLNVDMAEPDPEALEGLPLEFMWESGIIPLTRHGQVVTLCMPAIVPAETLGYIAASTDLLVVVVVGTVVSNRRWILNNTQTEVAVEDGIASLDGLDLEGGEDDGSWSNLFDEADAAVLQDLDSVEGLEVTDPSMDLSCLDESDGQLIADSEDFPEPVTKSEKEEPQPASKSPIDLPPPLPREVEEDSGGETTL